MKKTVYALLTAFLMMLAILGGTACDGNKAAISLDKSRYILYLDGASTASPIVSLRHKKDDYTLTSSNITIFSVVDGVLTGHKEGIASLTAVCGEESMQATVLVYESGESALIPTEEDGKVLITFYTNYSAVPSQRVFPGETAAVPAQPDVPDQVIEGWYTDTECTLPYDFSNPVTADLTLYAKWTAGANASYTFRTLINGTVCVDGLKYPLVAFSTLTLPSVDNSGNPVTSIYTKAFQDYIAVETVIIPASVTNIKTYAFAGCTSLKTVIFEGDSMLASIEAEAFWKCTSLNDITLPSRLTTVGAGTFNECSSLTSINLPNNLKTLETQTFMDTGLTSIDLANVTTLKSKVFYYAENLATITNPTKLNSVFVDVFTGTKWLTDTLAAASDGVAYLGTVLVTCKTYSDYRDITVREDTTLIANSALSGLSSATIRMSGTTPPLRGTDAVKLISQSTDITKSVINIVVPYSLYDTYRNSSDTDRNWSLYNGASYRQIYYSLMLAGGTAEFFVRTFNGKTSVALNKYTGSDVDLDLNAMLSNHFGTADYNLERIRPNAFYRLTALETITLPLQLGIIETYAFNQCTKLSKIKLAGYCAETFLPSMTKIESSNSFSSLSSSYKIHVPEGRTYNSSTSVWTSLYNSGKVLYYTP